MKDLMVDIESLGNGKNGLICQIGACYFDRTTGEIGDTFKVNIDLASAEASGGEFDASTVEWWLAQSEAARNSILADPKVSLLDAMSDFMNFIKASKAIWSHATFDFVILNETCKRLGLRQMPFRKARDIRTLVDLGKITTSKVPREGVHHDALADCLHQVKYCVMALNKVKGRSDANSAE